MGIAIVFLFVFIAGTGITWLVGIQTPLRFEGKQKKNWEVTTTDWSPTVSFGFIYPPLNLLIAL